MSKTAVYATIFVIYLIANIVITMMVRRSNQQTGESFFLGDRSIGAWPMAFSFVATLQSASLFMGSGPKVWQQGYPFLIWAMMLLTLGIVLAWLLLARPLSNLTGKFNVITLPELFDLRYNSQGIKLVVALGTCIFYIPLMGGQMVAAGKLFQMMFNVPFITGIVIMGVMLAVTTAIGGFRGVVFMDFFQGIIMYGIFLVLTPLMLYHAGGSFTAINHNIAANYPQMMQPITKYFTPLMILSWGIYFLFGLNLAQPSLLMRFLAMKDREVIKRAFPLTLTCHAWSMLNVMVVMLSARILFPTLTDRELVFPTMLTNVVPPVIGGLAICAVFAAMMSTVDSLILVVSSAFSEDLYKGFINKKASDKAIFWVGVASSLVVGVLAAWTACTSNEGVLYLIVMGESCIIPLYLFTVLGITHFKRLNGPGVIAGMIVGAAVGVWWGNVYSWDIVVPVMPAVIAGGIVTFVVSYLTPAPAKEITDTFFGDAPKEVLENYRIKFAETSKKAVV